MTEEDPRVTVTYLGGMLVPGLPKSLALELTEPATVAHLFRRLEDTLRIPDLRAQVAKYCIILLDGTSIQHLQGWETVLRPGAAVAIVASLGGG